MKRISVSLLLLLFVGACGSSGGDSSDGVVFEGQLTQGPEDSHSARIKHGEDEPIEEVQICALGRCGTTDGKGTFGFSAPDSYTGGDVNFTVSGHNTEASVVVPVPMNSKDVYVHLEKHSSSKVIVHHLEVDGVRVDMTHSDDSDHEHSSK